MALFIVNYPRNANSTFNESYYLKKHMPLVDKAFKEHGLVKWSIVENTTTPQGDPTPYGISAILEFKDLESAKKAIASPEAKPVFDDVVNFSNEQPIASFAVPKASSA